MKTFTLNYYELNSNNTVDSASSVINPLAVASVDYPSVKNNKHYFRINYTGGGYLDVYDYVMQNEVKMWDSIASFETAQRNIKNIRDSFLQQWNEALK